MREFMDVAKALADNNRVRALMALRKGELCVCQLIELLGLAPSTVSKHMSILRQARLVESRKQGRWIFYKLADNDASSEAMKAQAWVETCLKKDDEIKEDEKRLKEILKIDREELCKRQCVNC